MTAPEARTPGGNRADADTTEREQHFAAIEARERFEKRFATLRARLALKNFALHIIDGPEFFVQRWDRSASFVDLTGVEDFARRVGCAE